jgi:hypothetical protein
MVDVIKNHKEENEFEWDTNSVIDAVCEFLESQGYMAETADCDHHIYI